MASLNVIARQRKAALRVLQASMQEVNRKIDRGLSQIKRLRSRKILIPEAADYQKVNETLREMVNAVTIVGRVNQDVARIFIL